MQEFLWEIWVGKRNMHQRIAVNPNETPEQAFQRIVASLQGTEQEINTRALDPNTGRQVDVKWRFASRVQQAENNLQSAVPFANQATPENAVIVVRQVELRANTIYVDGIEGLDDDEMAAAKPKLPMIVGFLMLFTLLGGGAYYFLVVKPNQDKIAPHVVWVKTLPKGATVSVLLDTRRARGAKEAYSEIRAKKGTPAKLAIPRGAKVVQVTLGADGHEDWKRGYEQIKWGKDQSGPKKLKPLSIKEMVAGTFFPKKLTKAKVKKRRVIPVAAHHQPKATALKYPRRWRRMRVGFDPMHGGEKKGAVGLSDITARIINFNMVAAINKQFKNQRYRGRRRAYRSDVSRTGDVDVSEKKRIRALRRAKVIFQLDVADGRKEQPKNIQTGKDGARIIRYNDALAGFQIQWSPDAKNKEKVVKLAQCLSKSLNAAGFKPKALDAPDKASPEAKLGIYELPKAPALLTGRTPAIRLVVGYITHRAEEKALLDAKTYPLLGQALQASLICYTAK